MADVIPADSLETQTLHLTYRRHLHWFHWSFSFHSSKNYSKSSWYIIWEPGQFTVTYPEVSDLLVEDEPKGSYLTFPTVFPLMWLMIQIRTMHINTHWSDQSFRLGADSWCHHSTDTPPTERRILLITSCWRRLHRLVFTAELWICTCSVYSLYSGSAKPISTVRPSQKSH